MTQSMKEDQEQFEQKRLEHEARSERLRTGQGTAEDHAWQQRVIDEAQMAATPEVIAKLRADDERLQKELHEQQEAWDRRSKARDESIRAMQANVDRIKRIQSGIGTEEDLASMPFNDAEGTPWPEPTLTYL
jgi:hypothetical protein